MGWDVLGNERALEILQEGLHTERLPQSLLLTGPRLVGKRTLALELARAVNCTGEDPPCRACRACRLSGSGGYSDVHLVEVREGRQKIGIGEVQELQTELARLPSEGRRRVGLVIDAERLTAEAENCLLKTLEEPPAYAVIILTVEAAQALLPTTVSRCRQIRLRPVPAQSIEEHLVHRLGLDSDRARLLAGLSEGRPGWAIAAAADPLRLKAHEAALGRLREALGSGKLARLHIARALAETWSSKSDVVREELWVWARWWRDLLLVKLGLTEHIAHVGPQDELTRQAGQYSLDEIRAVLDALVQTRADLDQNVNPRLALDLALLRLPQARPAA